LTRAVFVRSPHAHARIRSIDASAARRAPGVVAVLTAAEAKADGLKQLRPYAEANVQTGERFIFDEQPLLAGEKVRFMGETVAMVIAETLAQALDAAELVEVDYEPLPAVTDLEDAARDGAPKVWDECPTGNVAYTLTMGDKAAADAAFAKAAHKVQLRVVNNPVSPNAMEPRGSIGDYSDADELFTLYTATQNPHGTRSALAGGVLHVPETAVRVVGRDVGGGFGLKGDAFPEDALTLYAARKIGRPVKWVATRSEGLMIDNHGRNHVTIGELALDGEGRIQALRLDCLAAIGAHLSQVGGILPTATLSMAPQVYHIPAAYMTARGVYSNVVALGAYRGAGRPEATYLMERLLDAAARQLKMDPAEIRRKNFIAADAFPYTTVSGTTYDSGDFAATMNACLKLAGWDGYAARQAESRKRGMLRGRALTYYIETCGIFNDRMELRFDPSGSVTIVAGTFSHGQGHATTFAQMASDWLGVPFESIRFLQGDTQQVAFGRGTYGSRTSSVGGSALRNAADNLIEKAKILAGRMLEAAPTDLEFKDGRFTIAGTDRAIPLVDVAKAAYAPFFLPPGFGVGLEASGAADGVPNFPNGCHVCELEVDPDTGRVTIDRYFVVDDVGMVVNPLIVEGQIVGGLAQGFGQALMENITYDRASGQLLTGSFTDYTMPRADDIPPIECDFHNVPCKSNVLGVKGAGEAGSVGAPPAVVNALIDALAPLGVNDIDMPATPLKVWQSIQAAKPARAA
ncbi:MAG TPA: xanthine dehydrogenase family protein molybdopterin-binding subunit, partial [Hyphomicrobiales bacterium]|nr:xanthine dehydrogenase family protein molybdopterin-binding subunit [Hyphomicrobiales bacterium]